MKTLKETVEAKKDLEKKIARLLKKFEKDYEGIKVGKVDIREGLFDPSFRFVDISLDLNDHCC